MFSGDQKRTLGRNVNTYGGAFWKNNGQRSLIDNRRCL